MFSNLGLLKNGICPDGTGCRRVRCFFTHNDEPRPRQKTGTNGSSSAAIDASSTARKRPPETPTSQARDMTSKKRAVEPSAGIKGTVERPLQPVVKEMKVSEVS